MKHSFGEETLSMCSVFLHLALVESRRSLRHKPEIRGPTKKPPGPEDNGPMHINYGGSRMAYDKQQ